MTHLAMDVQIEINYGAEENIANIVSLTSRPRIENAILNRLGLIR